MQLSPYPRATPKYAPTVWWSPRQSKPRYLSFVLFSLSTMKLGLNMLTQASSAWPYHRNHYKSWQVLLLYRPSSSHLWQAPICNLFFFQRIQSRFVLSSKEVWKSLWNKTQDFCFWLWDKTGETCAWSHSITSFWLRSKPYCFMLWTGIHFSFRS